MKLELKHIAPYLPYGLNWFCLDMDSREFENIGTQKIDLTNEVLEIGGMEIDLSELPYPNGLTVKPILRPLSDLTKEIEVNGEKFVPVSRLYKLQSCCNAYWEDNNMFDSFTEEDSIVGEELSISEWEKLLEWHFDIHNLIPNGLAIDINTLQK